jgi:hypothetical protein
MSRLSSRIFYSLFLVLRLKSVFSHRFWLIRDINNIELSDSGRDFPGT